MRSPKEFHQGTDLGAQRKSLREIFKVWSPEPLEAANPPKKRNRLKTKKEKKKKNGENQ